MNQCLWTVLLLACSLTGVHYTYAQGNPFRFKSISQTDGLASDYVQAILQDSQGFMWFATENGLNRYDGTHFLQFRFDPEDSTSLSGNFIYALFEDSRQRLWVGSTNGLDLLDRSSGSFTRIPFVDQNDRPVNLKINSIYEDSQHTIWATAGYGELYKIVEDAQKQTMQAVPLPVLFDEEDSQVLKIICADDSYLWVTTNRGIGRVYLQTEAVDHFLFPYPTDGLGREANATGAFRNEDGLIFVHRLDRPIFYIDPTDAEAGLRPFTDLFPKQRALPFRNDSHWRYEFDGPDHLLAVTRQNLYRVDLQSGKYTELATEFQDRKLFGNYGISSFYIDRSDNLWIGTYGGGIRIALPSDRLFIFNRNDPEDPGSITGGPIRSIIPDGKGGLWVASLNSGLNQFVFGTDGNLRKARNIIDLPGLVPTLNGIGLIQVVRDDDDQLWLATNLNGLIRLDPESLATTSYLPDNRIWGLEIDHRQNVWTGSWAGGLTRLEPESGQMKHYRSGVDSRRSPVSDQIRCLYLENEQFLWIGTENGLSRMDLQTETFTHFQNEPDNARSLSNNLVWGVCKQANGTIWVATNSGLNKLDPETGTFERFYEKQGLPSNGVYGLLEDSRGTLWVSTVNGLARMITGTEGIAFQSIKAEDGLVLSSFLPKAYYRHRPSNELFFGTSDGLVTVRPHLLTENSRPFQPTMHALSILRAESSSSALQTEYFINDETKAITLDHLDKFVEISLADLSWELAQNFRYDYRLQGLNKQWMELGSDMKMTFTSLAPGDYQLEVRRSGIDGRPPEPVKMLSIHMLSPWWKRWWAYMLYALLGGGLIVAINRIQLHRRLERQETENLRTLNEFKNTFYTNITHEFRTPLTVIKGMAEQLDVRQEPREVGRIRMLIKRNSENLLRLVDQILDLRKVETGKMHLELVQADVVKYIQYILDSYQAMAELKSIQLHFIARESSLLMDFDREKLLQIVSNLLSNAIKFTPEAGNVYLILEKTSAAPTAGTVVENLSLQVTDTGIGIPKDQQSQIFERFYQVNDDQKRPAGAPAYRGSGSGIGLALTKELVNLMGGRIKLHSVPNEGATFTVLLPISRQASREQLTPEDVPGVAMESSLTGSLGEAPSKATVPGDQKPNLLIVEDSPDVQEYLTSLLETDYNISLAGNGQEGIEQAFSTVPDLIISDVMMPEKDGFELCDTLKQDDRTSHIPIVLLTAKTSVESRIEGFQRGADAYLAKPFNQGELLARLQNLHELRWKLQQRYRHLDPPASLKEEPAVPGFEQEDAFMAKLVKAVEDHLDDPDFGPNELGNVMGVSRSQLHRKLKALTNLSASIFIRTIRLHRAKEMLEAGELNVTQVAFEVGIHNLSYFSTLFSEEFGFSPKTLLSNKQ